VSSRNPSDRLALEAAAARLDSYGEKDLAERLRRLGRREYARARRIPADEMEAIAWAMRELNDADLHALFLAAQRFKSSQLTARVLMRAGQLQRRRRPQSNT
jgi:hypothetical protein